MRREDRLARALVRALALAAGALAVATLAVTAAGLHERVARADLAVVLGARVWRDGTMSASLRERCDRAAQVYRAGLAPRLLLSGGVDRGRRVQATAMRAYLIARGVPDSALFVDARGANTWRTAADTRAFLAAHGGGRVLIVSQYYHLPRCRLAFARWGVPVAGWTYPRAYQALDLPATAREVAALAKYALRPAPPAPATR